MATVELSLEAIEEVARTELDQACDMARELVAERLHDEDAALLLRELVRRQVAQGMGVPADGPELAPAVAEAARLLEAGRDQDAEILLRRHLSQHPEDVSAMVRMADIAARCEFYDDAERILERAQSIDPQSAEVKLTRARLASRLSLMDGGDGGETAMALVQSVLDDDPDNAAALTLQTSILVHYRKHEQALESYRRRVAVEPLNWQAWVNFAQLLANFGRAGEAAAAIRTCVAINPAHGFAWWEFTNLKLAELFETDVAEMRRVIAEDRLDPSSAGAIHLALGKALHQRGKRAEAAQHWEEGNRIKSTALRHDADYVQNETTASIRTFTPEFFAERSGWGDPSPDPIFIIGMQRSGSTLVEQILASHPSIEATEELFIVLRLGQEIAQLHPSVPWQQSVARMTASELSALGSRFMNLAPHFRSTNRPFFIDKNPANWRFVGLIAAMLPNAKFIDVRRNPMDCCFANYTHYYEKGVSFAYSQRDLGRYYSDYVRLMRHFDEVRPGMVHRLIYDDLVDDLEGHVRRLLDYLGVPFDDACLRFFETDRAVLTPSAQQVRQPINKAGIGRWRGYEPWLGELQEALGEIAGDWRR